MEQRQRANFPRSARLADFPQKNRGGNFIFFGVGVGVGVLEAEGVRVIGIRYR